MIDLFVIPFILKVGSVKLSKFLTIFFYNKQDLHHFRLVGFSVVGKLNRMTIFNP